MIHQLINRQTLESCTEVLEWNLKTCLYKIPVEGWVVRNLIRITASRLRILKIPFIEL